MVRKLIPCQIDVDTVTHFGLDPEFSDIVKRLDRLSEILHVNLSLLVVDVEFYIVALKSFLPELLCVLMRITLCLPLLWC